MSISIPSLDVRALWLFAFLASAMSVRAETSGPNLILARPGIFKSLTEPPCSYCSTQNRKNVIRADDRVIAWVRGDHNGGAAPVRLFLAGPRVLNDTYG